jgi:hypothetical protein
LTTKGSGVAVWNAVLTLVLVLEMEALLVSVPGAEMDAYPLAVGVRVVELVADSELVTLHVDVGDADDDGLRVADMVGDADCVMVGFVLAVTLLVCVVVAAGDMLDDVDAPMLKVAVGVCGLEGVGVIDEVWLVLLVPVWEADAVELNDGVSDAVTLGVIDKEWELENDLLVVAVVVCVPDMVVLGVRVLLAVGVALGDATLEKDSL